MKAVGIRELKNRLSEYLRMVRAGEGVLVTDRGVVIAELRQPARTLPAGPYPLLEAYIRSGRARAGAPNRPEIYPELPPLLPPGRVQELLDEERGER